MTKRWTVIDYHRMADLALIDPGERTELIDGQIIIMAPKGTPHVLALRLLNTQIGDALRDRPVFMSIQDPIHIDDFSEPEPDLAIVQGKPLDYIDHHPYPEQVKLIVEIADATLKQDCEIKDKLYAQAGIEDYWVLDVRHRHLHLFRDPTATGYTRHTILKEPNTIAPLAFPELMVSLTAILPPIV